MKKTILTLSILFLASGIFAQTKQAIPEKEKLQQAQDLKAQKQNLHKTGETVIYYEDFDGGLPDDWQMVDLGGEGLEWYWSNSLIQGCYTDINVIEDMHSESPENGVMVINPDGFNSVPQYTTASEGAVMAPDLTACNAYLEFGPLDLSNYPGIFISFFQSFRNYYDFHTVVAVSNDYIQDNPDMAHWIEYRTQEIPLGGAIWNELKIINISELAAGHDSVYIRIHAYGATHYWWIIDDVKLLLPFENNMVLNNSWLFYDWIEEPPEESPAAMPGYLNHGGGYCKIPKDHALPIVGNQIAIENLGFQDQHNVISKTEIYYKQDMQSTDSVLVHSFHSELYEFIAYSFDSIRSLTGYIPDEWGHYEVYMSVESEHDDDYPDDNTHHFEFEIFPGDFDAYQTVYSRAGYQITGSAATRQWIGGGIDGDRLGQYFKLNKPITEVEALRFYFDEKNAEFESYINAGGFKAIAKIFTWNEDLENWNTIPQIESDPFIPTMQDTGSYIRLDFIKNGYSEFLPSGDYCVTLETYTGVDEGEYGTIGFYIGEDRSVKQPEGTQVLWLENNWGWTYSANFYFDFILATDSWDNVNETNIEEKKIALLQNYPNPANNKTEIKYIMHETSEVVFVLQDVTGKEILKLNEGLKTKGNYSVAVDVSGLKPGVYFYSLVTDGEKVTRKMIKTLK